MTTSVRPQVKWSGVNRAGATEWGTASISDLPAWVKTQFDRRWQALTVTRNGETVGGIHKVDGRRRVWWAES